jgi:hypothetical protein
MVGHGRLPLRRRECPAVPSLRPLCERLRIRLAHGARTRRAADHEIGPRPWKKLPGGHAVYYRREENYGALGIVALDEKLDWTGIGSRRFEAKSAAGAPRSP